RMFTNTGKMLAWWFSLTDDQRVPMPISTQDQMNRLRLPLYRSMQLDLDGLAHLGRNDEMFLVFLQVHIFAVLPQVDGMPLVAFLESWERHLQSKLFAGKKSMEMLGAKICPP